MGASAGLTAHVERAIQASDARIVVTGASGWIGMSTLELLRSALGEEFAGRVHCFGSSRRALVLLDGTSIEQRPLGDIVSLKAAPTIVLHLAFLTKDRAEAMDEETYRAANQQLDRMLIDALDPIGAEAVFVASSGAAYRADDPAASPAMRLYGALKCEQEEQFADWADRCRKRAVITRIFNISGPHINKHQSYALAAFIMDAIASRAITIKSPHHVVRSYVAVREMMSLAFALLLDGRQTVTRFDSGGEPMEMQEIAGTVSRLLGPVSIERPPLDSAGTDHYAGDVAAYDKLLAEHRIDPVSFERQVIETAEFLVRFQPPLTGGRVVMEQRSC
jgi:nucleoside-diphosphate-sugar epimerase